MATKTAASPESNELAQALITGIREAIKESRPKEFDALEHLRREQELDPGRNLIRPTFHHNVPVNLRGCSDETVKQLNELKPGRYIKGMVTVEIRGDAPNDALYIETPFQNKDERMRFYMEIGGKFSNMVAMVTKEIKEREAAKE